MCKENTILNEVIYNHHPRFNKLPAEVIDSFEPTDFNVPRLVEEAVADVADSEFVDGEGYDLADGTEVKTASIRPTPINKKKIPTCSHAYEISGVVSSGGKEKTGALRIVLYNPVLEKLTYYFIPKDAWTKLGVSIHPTTKKGKIVGSWNSKKNIVSKIAPYEVESFEKMSKIPADYNS